MLRAGALTQSQFEEASTLVETGQRFGSAIAEMGIYGVERIIAWVQRQVLQITASVLDYPAGRYFFFSSLEKNVVPEIGGVPLPLGRLLLAAVGKAGDLPLDQLAEDSDLQVELAPDTLRLFKAEDLEDGERQLLGLISQRISAKRAVAQSGLPRPEASRALYALLLLGFVNGVADHVRPEPSLSLPFPARLLRPNNRKRPKLPMPRTFQNSGLWTPQRPRRKRPLRQAKPLLQETASTRSLSSNRYQTIQRNQKKRKHRLRRTSRF